MDGVYYVAQIDTRYGVMGLADTEEVAIRVAAVRAKQFLDAVGGFDPDMGEAWTVERIIDYFDPRVTAIPLGSAVLEGEA
jgi:hypothetical protein